MFRFPYTDTHELNTDWIIKRIREFSVKIAAFTKDLEEFARNFPRRTSQLINDSGYITAAQAPVQTVNNKTGNVVLSTSDLANTSGYITAAQAPVQSVNNKTGNVSIDYTDVGALSDSYAPTISGIQSNIVSLTNDSALLQQIFSPIGTISSVRVPGATRVLNQIFAQRYAIQTGFEYDVNSDILYQYFLWGLNGIGDTRNYYVLFDTAGGAEYELTIDNAPVKLLQTGHGQNFKNSAYASSVSSTRPIIDCRLCAQALDENNNVIETIYSAQYRYSYANGAVTRTRFITANQAPEIIIDMGLWKNLTSASDMIGRYTPDMWQTALLPLAVGVQSADFRFDIPDATFNGANFGYSLCVMNGRGDLYEGPTIYQAEETTAQILPYGELDNTSTATVMTATIPGIDALIDGTFIILRNNVITSAAGVTLNINGLGAKPLVNSMTDTTPISTTFKKEYTMLFIYDAERVAGGCWLMYYGYNTDTNTIAYMVRNQTTMAMDGVLYRYRLMFQSADHKSYVAANQSTSTSANAAKAVTTKKINPFGPIWYYSTTTAVTDGSRPGTTYVWDRYVTDSIGYSFNPDGTTPNLTLYEPVYIVCTPQNDGSAIIDPTTPYTQTLPTTEDGKIYIVLGIANTSTKIDLWDKHPIYQFKNGKICLYTGN